MPSKERLPQLPPEVVKLDQYFNLFDSPELSDELGSLEGYKRSPEQDFKRTVIVDLKDFPLWISVGSYWIWQDMPSLPIYYPAFTPYDPERGFTINNDENLPVKWKNMLREATQWYKEGMSPITHPRVYDSLCQDSIRLDVLSDDTMSLTDEQENFLKRLRFRVEFGEGDPEKKLLGSSYDAEAKIIDGPNGPDRKWIKFDGYSPSDIPFFVVAPFLKDGLPIRLADPTFSGNIDWVKKIRGKFYLASEGLLPEYEASSRVTESREFKPTQELQ